MTHIFSCKRCGHCCHGQTTVSLDADDQAIMLELLKISEEEALQKFWRRSGSVIQMQILNGHCIFYDDGCTMHAGRPKKCREWPLVRAIVTDKINLETIRSFCCGLSSTASYEEICKEIVQNNDLEEKSSDNRPKS